jgi:gliding motility-associated-like protein
MCNLGTYEDWVELYNTTAAPINLTNYYLSNKKTNITKWQLGNVTIPANGFLRIWASGSNVNVGPNLHTNFSLTQCKFDNIIFSSPTAVVIDSLTIRPAQVGHSRGRTTDGAATWSVFLNPTPNASNTGAKPNYAATPVMSVAPGFYAGPQLVTITCSTPSTTIRYTTNGKTPTAASTLYAGPVNIATTKVLRAVAISSAPGVPSSFIESNTYFINSPHTVSVVSIFGDSTADLMAGTQFYPQTGIQYFDSSGTFRTEGYGATNKHGNDSWSYPQRGIDFVSYDQYGYSDVLKHRFFNTKSRTDFQHIILKAAANDNYPFECPAAGSPSAWGDPTLFDGAHIRDAYVQTVAQKANMHLDIRTWAPCVMYVNGTYWGVYDLREKVDDKDYTKYYDNTTSDSLQFIKNWGGVWAAYGGTQALNDWTTMKNYITTNSMAVAANYNHVDSLFSIKSFVDYILINSYCVTSDWLNWNSEWWRGTNTSSTKKKWRYALWDLDATFHHYINYTGIPNNNANASPCDPQGLTPSPPDYGGNIDILNALMNNPTFKQYYVMRYFDLVNTGLSCTRMTQILDSMILQIAPEMPGQVTRWGGSVPAWQQNVQDLRNFILQRCDSIVHQFDSCYNTTGPYLIKVNVDPPNSGTVDFNSMHLTSFLWSGVYPGSMSISLAEHAKPGFCFSHWSLKNNIPLPSNLDSAITVMLLNTDSIVAHFDSCHFTPPNVVVKVNVVPPGAGTVDFNAVHLTSFVWSGSYAPGTTVTLAQIPNPNFCFSHWSLQNNTALPSNLDSLISVNLVNPDSIVAHYDSCYPAVLNIVKVNVVPPGAGTVQFNAFHLTSFVWSATYPVGSTVTLAQIPNANYCFTNWTLKNNTPLPSNLDSLISVNLINPDSIVAHYIVSPKPTILPINPKICDGDSVQLTVSTALSYSWSPASNLSCANCPNPYAHPSSTTIYTVTVLNTAPNCMNKNTQLVTVIPNAAASFADTIVSGTSIPALVHFGSTSTQSSSYLWNFGSGFNVSGINPSYTYSVAGTYPVSLIAINSSGCNDTITRSIVIRDTAGVIIPNVFTPNGDGVNDYFQPIFHNVKDFACTIFDRWGKVIYDFSGVNDKWGGQTQQGGAVPDGTYYYIVKAKDNNDKDYNLKGFLQLVR